MSDFGLDSAFQKWQGARPRATAGRHHQKWWICYGQTSCTNANQGHLAHQRTTQFGKVDYWSPYLRARAHHLSRPLTDPFSSLTYAPKYIMPILRQSLADVWNKDDSLIQLGGRKGCSTDVAHHFLHAHLAWARDANVSCAILFVDLQSAFYSVLRSSFFEGNFHDDAICYAMKQLGITPDEWPRNQKINCC